MLSLSLAIWPSFRPLSKLQVPSPLDHPIYALRRLPRRSLPRASSSRRSIHLLHQIAATGTGCSVFGIRDGQSYTELQIARASTSGLSSSDADDVNKLIGSGGVEESVFGTSFVAKLAIAMGVAVTMTVLACISKSSTSEPSFHFSVVADGLPQSAQLSPSTAFTFKLFGYRVFLPEYTPGWVYFWLLMAAGCGLFISEEALNIWVGITIARKLSLDGTWSSFAHSFSNNAAHIVSTVLWVYWGVCISDMVPFYLGRLFRQTKTSQDICSKLGNSKDKVVGITRAVQKYGNLIGFVERFSIGVRNPTSFLAGAWGISADCFFAGVCFGGIFTLLIQLGIGFLLKDHPLMALAGVATFVGIWTVFPYALAASTALFLYLRRRHK